MQLDNAETFVKSLDAFIAEQEEILAKARSAREFFILLTPAKTVRYRVPSRSGGNDHIISVTGDDWSCDCAAGLGGKRCWASWGVEDYLTCNIVARSGSIWAGNEYVTFERI